MWEKALRFQNFRGMLRTSRECLAGGKFCFFLWVVWHVAGWVGKERDSFEVCLPNFLHPFTLALVRGYPSQLNCEKSLVHQAPTAFAPISWLRAWMAWRRLRSQPDVRMAAQPRILHLRTHLGELATRSQDASAMRTNF